MIIPKIWKNKIHVPKHQPGLHVFKIYHQQSLLARLEQCLNAAMCPIETGWYGLYQESPILILNKGVYNPLWFVHAKC